MSHAVQLFTAADGQVQLSVSIDKETVWLTQEQMGHLFERERSVITKHIRNVFAEGELEREAVCAKFAHTAADGKTYQVDYYNLDVIISVGYRVKSRRGVQFRQWATRTLKEHLVQGYTLNQRRLAERGIEFEQALALLSRTLANQQLVNADGAAVLAVIADYARSWSLLQAYDEQSLSGQTGQQSGMRTLHFDEVLSAVAQLKAALIAKGEATALFGQLRGDGLASSIATIEQGFGDELFYPNVASRAAHLLYFVIKNHPLSDGNKRTGSFLFLWYLQLNQHLLAKPVAQLINDNTLVALALLVAGKRARPKGLDGAADRAVCAAEGGMTVMLNEQQLEQHCIGWFQEAGWQFVHGPDIAPEGIHPERADYRQVILRDRLLAALARINPHMPAAALEQAVHAVHTLSAPQMVVRNRSFHRLLLSGVALEFADGEAKKTDLVHLIDFANPQLNEFVVMNQFTVAGSKQPRRPDLVAFINGLPLAVIELKNPANEHTDVWDAFNQLQTYKDEISALFNSNVALVVSDGWTARVGSLTANAERMLPWRTLANEDDRPRVQLELETVVRGFFAPELFLDYIRHFVLFEQDGDAVIKKIAGYHQFHAVREAVRATVIAASSPAKGVLEVREERATYGKEVKPGSRKAGVVWHTQGSGKSITMACYAGKLLQQPQMKNPTLVVVTDRNDLDGQLFATFCAAADLLKTTPLQAGSRDELREMLASRQAGGIIFTTVQKFALLDAEDEHPLLSERANIVVISDEAHRSQYGMKGRLVQKSGRYVFGYAKHLRDALKNATFIGFTGTPIALEDKDTRAVFGDYVSIYDIQDAVDDGATVPIFYESRLARLDVKKAERDRRAQRTGR